MLATILTVLKVIGIILLVILLTILVVAGLILFVPIRYKAGGYYRDTYAVKANVSWLLHFLNVKLLLVKDNELQLIVRILGIPIYNMQKRKEKQTKKTKSETTKAVDEEETSDEEASDEETYEESIEITKPPVPHRIGSEKLMDNIPSEEKAKESILEKVINIWKKLWIKCKQSIENIKYTFRKMCDKMKNIRDNITYYLELLEKPSTKHAIGICKKELLRIWKDIKPRKFKLNARIGMEDPATTGQITGYCAMLYPLHNGNISIIPEFEDKIIEADFTLKGKITVYVYLIVAYTILFNKNIRHLKKCLLREDS